MKFLLQGLLAVLLFGAGPLTRAVDFTLSQAGRIAFATGQVLDRLHYRRAPLDDVISEKFLKKYLDTLDGSHLVFVQSDIDEFEAKFGKRLDDLTLPKDERSIASAKPAWDIFDRYLLRLKERTAFTTNVLKEKFDFTTDESIVSDRHKAEWPKDKAEAEQLWRGRIKFELLSARLGKEKEEDAVKRIAKRYDRLEKMYAEFDNEDILQTYLDSLAHVYDPHSDYMGPTQAQEFDIKSVSLKLSGIGATLQSDESGYTKIVSMVPNGPAAKSKKLHPNDRIVAVAQGKGEAVDVVEMRLTKVVQLIRGERGTPVTLTIIPADSSDGTAREQITIVRDEIRLKDQFAKGRIYDHVNEDGKMQRLGFIELPGFYDNCSEHVEMLINRLKEKVEGIVLDLRHNGGGLLEESVNLTGLFISKGPVVQVQDSDRKPATVYSDTDPKVVWDGPLIVLTSRLSASASEITAAALQDYGRALIVGDQTTHGKGTVQKVIGLDRLLGGPQGRAKDPMPSPGTVKVTSSKFYRVAGSTTQKQGVTPDIVLPSIYDYLDIGESSLDNALEADSISPAKYEMVAEVKQYVAELDKASKARVAKNKDFAYLLEDIAEVKKRKEEKTISLNEKIRIAERDDQKVRTEARKKERAARPAPADKAWGVDLETAEKGKPLVAYTNKKTDEEKALTAPPTKATPDADDDSVDEDNDLGFDAHIVESINILGDYAHLLAGSPLSNGSVALKKNDKVRTATP